MRSLILASLAATLSASVLGASPAVAATTCTFSSPTVTVTLNANGDDAFIEVDAGAIEVNGVACQAATVNTTDTIIVTTDNVSDADDSIVTISHLGGKFQPGLTPEGGSGISEIEWQITLGDGSDELRFIGTNANDNVAIGAGGGNPVINLNANESPDDADVAFDLDSDIITLNGGSGNDQLRGIGGSATGAAYPTFLVLQGARGDDTLLGGAGRDIVNGGAGADTLGGGAHDDSISGGDGGDTVTAAQGNDSVNGNAGADTLYGGSDADTITGGLGQDALYGQSGLDILKAVDGVVDVVNGGPPAAGDFCQVDTIDTVNC